jgi:hypothetical protein
LNFSHVIGQDGRKLYYLPLGVLPQPASTGQIPGLGFQKLWMSPFSVRKMHQMMIIFCDVILIQKHDNHFAKTGSGQTQGKHSKKELRFFAGVSVLPGDDDRQENAFSRRFMLNKTRSFCQDRLRTDTCRKS